MKINIKHLNKFINYHWHFSSSSVNEPDVWMNRVVKITPALRNSQIGFPFEVIKKSLSLVKVTAKMVINCVTVKSSNRLRWFEKLLKVDESSANVYRGICYCPENFQPTFLITDPNIITAILMHERNEEGDQAMFSGGVPVQVAKKILGNNILTCSETEHKNLQNFSAPHFVSHAMNSYFSAFLQQSFSLLQKWMKQGDKPVDVSYDLILFAARAVAEIILGFQRPIKDLCEAMHTLLTISSKKILLPKHKRLYQKAMSFIQSSAEEVFQSENRNFLRCMKEAKDKNGQPKFQLEEIVSMAKILFFAGQDSTSTLIAFLLHTLGQKQFQYIQEKLYHEYKNGGEHDFLNFINTSITLDHLFKEALRFYPPAYTQTRETVQDILIDDQVFIPKGSLLYLIHYFSQRDSRRWGNTSLQFNPERFEDPSFNAKAHGPLQYFSLGPSICLGRHFVMLLMKTFIMEMIRNVTWKSCEPVPHINADIMLELKPQVNIQFFKR